MQEVAANLFVLCLSYAIVGNAIAYVILARRGIPVRFLWAGTPGYLYRVSSEDPRAGASLRRYCLSTNIAFVLAFVFAFGLASAIR